MTRAALFTSSSLLSLVVALQSAVAADAVSPYAVPYPTSHAAVSAPNGKFGAFGGSIDGLTGWGIDGAYSVPLTQQWGAQIDGLAGTGGGDAFWGAAGHLFWRDPTVGLLGLYGSWVAWSNAGANVSKVGIEGQMYNGRFTLGGNIVEQGGTFSGLAGEADLSYYAGDNFRLDGGYRFLQGIGGVGSVGAEWLPNNNGFGLFATGNFGQSGYSTVLGGLKFYTGAPKSLIGRDRQDDPPVALPLDLFQQPVSAETTCAP
jgi:hypothetical protein